MKKISEKQRTLLLEKSVKQVIKKRKPVIKNRDNELKDVNYEIDKTQKELRRLGKLKRNIEANYKKEVREIISLVSSDNKISNKSIIKRS